jgi:ABC-type sugar transport system substrate-binding protein
MRQIRRMLLQALGAVCVIAGHASPQVANAQAARKVYRIGVLGPDISDAAGPLWDAFVDELAQRGYRERRNVVFERRFGRDDRGG